ncbi:KEOPS complex subunit Bud32 [Bienertia sinuspersici]
MEMEADRKDMDLILLKQGAKLEFLSQPLLEGILYKGAFFQEEARCMTKARKLGVVTPVLFSVDPVLHTLTFEYVEGPMVKEMFLEFGTTGIVEERLQDIATQIGDSIAKLHDGGLIHGDLTTSTCSHRLWSELYLYFTRRQSSGPVRA